jgi:hypothetical protein
LQPRLLVAFTQWRGQQGNPLFEREQLFVRRVRREPGEVVALGARSTIRWLGGSESSRQKFQSGTSKYMGRTK